MSQASTITNLYYQQVMDNLAIHASQPNALPYFSYAGTGQNLLNRTIGPVNYNIGWDLITSAGALFNRYLVDKQFAQIAASNQNGETWTTTTTYDPDKIQLMKFAYDKAFGVIDPIEENVLRSFLYNPKAADIPGNIRKDDEQKQRPGLRSEPLPLTPGVTDTELKIAGNLRFPLNYYDKLYPGWFGVGRRHDVPKGACYVAHCGHHYVWVMPNNMNDLANFTLVILDIATYQSGGSRDRPSGVQGTSALPAAPQ